MSVAKTVRTLIQLFPPTDERQAEACAPERITLGVREGVRPSPKPPVQLFVGTEPAQYRAERIFLWSIEQVRDPARMYEIYLMKNLAGFDRRGWLTGFTNYRFAIPHFAMQSDIERAIYNDVDQVYLADPGELFDTEIGQHGFLSISDRDTSVMLIDCARMASVWSLEAVQHERRKTIEDQARRLWGWLDPTWNARDEEYQPGCSQVLHYTTIHAQPWQPFPERYAYQRNSVAHVWFDLERAANQASYHLLHPTQSETRPKTQMNNPPRVWVLTSNKPGHSTQSLGLAEALGWPYEVKKLAFTRTAATHKRLFGIRSATCAGLDKTQSAALTPPWPDVVITAGWRPARVARWIREQSKGQTHLVLLGRKGGQLTAPSDIVVSCHHFRQPPHPRRIETIAPLSLVRPERLEHAAHEWREQLASARHPRIALFVGGSTARYQFDVAIAQQIGQDVRAFAEQAGGSVFVTTSRRTGSEASAALQEALGPVHTMHVWQADQKANPYFAYLTLADVLIVTGESESMLAEAAATHKPVYIYPLPERPENMLNLRHLASQLREWIVARAQQPQRNARGTIRPQRGLAYQCARLVERGVIQPRRDLNLLHQTLVDGGFAHFFGEPFTTDPRPVLQEFDTVAQQVRTLLGQDAQDTQDA